MHVSPRDLAAGLPCVNLLAIRLRLVATGWRHGLSAASLAVRNTLFLLARPRGLEPLTF